MMKKLGEIPHPNSTWNKAHLDEKVEKNNPKKSEKNNKLKKFNTCHVEIGPKAWKTKKIKSSFWGEWVDIGPPSPLS
jgi:hypothetical protein